MALSAVPDLLGGGGQEGGHCWPSSGGPLCSGHRPSEPSGSAQPPSFPHSLFCPTPSFACDLHPNLMKPWYPHFPDTESEAQSSEKMCPQVTHEWPLWPGCEPGVSAPKPGPVPLCPVLLAEGPQLAIMSFEVGWPPQLLLGGRPARRPGLWGAGTSWHRAQVTSPDGKSAVPVTSFVACSRAVFRNFEWLVTSYGCSFRPARSGQI